jgi:Sulfotransferase domain
MEYAPKPNFFIVGAPKSGTTALYSFLGKHPQIFLSKPKEPQFFAADICGDQRKLRTLPEYLNCFQEARTDLIGEASTCYLASSMAASQIRQFCPEARIIIMLRNPIDVMRAEHSERVVGGSEHITNFESALDSRESRIYRSGPFKGQQVVRPSYRDVTRFSEQVKRFLHSFGPQKVHIILYDEFAQNASLSCRNVLAFLGLSPNWECAVEVVNANRRIRSKRIQDWLRCPPKLLQGLARALLPAATRPKIAACLYKLNVEFVQRPALDPKFSRRLVFEYREEVQELARLIDRDLSNWMAA